MGSTTMTVHPSAIISDGAKIHETAEIGPYVVIGPNVTIGRGTKIGAHSVIDGYTTIGEDCRFSPGVAVGLEPQDLSYKGEPTGVIIGNRTTLREYVTVHRGTGDRFTTLGDDCFLMNYCHVAHDCKLGNGVIMANSAQMAGHVQVGDFTVMSGFVVFHQHIRVGRMCMIGAMSGARQDLPPFTMVDGRPMMATGLNVIGLRRRKVAPDVRAAIKSAYRFIYRSGLNNTQAMERIEAELPQFDEIKEIVEFIRASKRGIVSAWSKDIATVRADLEDTEPQDF